MQSSSITKCLTRKKSWRGNFSMYSFLYFVFSYCDKKKHVNIVLGFPNYLFIFFIILFCCSSEGRKKVRKLHLPMFLYTVSFNFISFPNILLIIYVPDHQRKRRRQVRRCPLMFFLFSFKHILPTCSSIYS